MRIITVLSGARNRADILSHFSPHSHIFIHFKLLFHLRVCVARALSSPLLFISQTGSGTHQRPIERGEDEKLTTRRHLVPRARSIKLHLRFSVRLNGVVLN
jgi:hypothetical protein